MENKDHDSFVKYFLDNDAMGSIFQYKFISLSNQECTLEYEVSKKHFNPNGILHGGALYSVMDSSQGAFIHYILDQKYKFAATGTSTIIYKAPLTRGVIKVRTYLKEIQNRKHFITSIATDESGNQVATLEEIWIAVLN